jgi:CheY-like chemotaxis protein
LDSALNPRADATPLAPARPFSAMRVLIADDNPDAAETLAAFLRIEFGCMVTTAHDGRSALQQARTEPPDVLILDVRMPDMSGVDVVRELRRPVSTGRSPPQPALCLAVTGKDVSDALHDIDRCFDAAFAKPVDLAALAALLRRHWQGGAGARPLLEVDLAELTCEVARRSTPMLRTHGHLLCFDYRGPVLRAELDETGLHAGVYRLLCAVADLVDGGFVVLKANAHEAGDGRCSLVVHIAAAGAPRPATAVAAVLERLELVDVLGSDPAGAADVVAAHTAVGVCTGSGAQVRCVVAPGEGVLFRYELPVRPLATVDTSADAQGTRAWIIDAAQVSAALLQRRLQRLGWRVRRFDTLAAAVERAGQTPLDAMPALVIAMEGDDAPAWADLQAAVPPGVPCVRVVAIGSMLRTQPVGPGRQQLVLVDPVSPGELVELTRRLGGAVDDADSGPPTGAAAWQDRPRLLVVDDVEVNRIVASGLAAALGYEVSVVADGLDAIRHCRQSAPDVVLMDVQMPVLGGLDATGTIRQLQRLGKLPPFPIVAATADDDAQTREQCRQAGMDGFVGKPLALQALREELSRVTLHAPP